MPNAVDQGPARRLRRAGQAGLGLALLALAAVAVAAGSMGPLRPYLLNGTQGFWTGRSASDTYWLSNRFDADDFYLVYRQPARVPGQALEVRAQVSVRAADTGASAGLLYAYEPQSGAYYAFTLTADGAQVVRHGPGSRAVQVVVSNPAVDGSRKRRLSLVEGAGSDRDRVRFLVDGVEIAALKNAEMGTGAVGIIARGRGEFGFSGFRMARVPPERAR